MTGEDPLVEDYVLNSPETASFLQKLSDMLLFLLPYYVREGKSHFVVAIGCTGGKHRSVALARNIGRVLKTEGYRVAVKHRDIMKG